jgi:polar amino acid transport system substrate-binding protein
VAVSVTSPPFAYIGKDRELKGYSVELAIRFAVHENMGVKFTDVKFDGLTPYVISGKGDLAISNVTITEERKKSVLFTHPIYNDLAGIIVLKETGAGAAGFIGRLKMAAERNLLVENRWKLILNGLGITMIISLAAQFLGTAGGCGICYLLTRKNKLARRSAELYCGLIYGTPMVVLLMVSYYIIFGSSNVSNIMVAVAAFSMAQSAIIAKNLKGAIDSVNHAEIEAALSMGFTQGGAFRAVTFPQAVNRALPAYMSGFVGLVKSTAVVGYIAIQDLTRAGDIIRGRTYDAYFPLLLVTLIYLAVTTICVRIFKIVVKKVNGGIAQ